MQARSTQSGQALVEWAISAFLLLLFAFSLLAVGHVVGEYMAVRAASSQAAFAAARAPSVQAAQAAGRRAARLDRPRADRAVQEPQPMNTQRQAGERGQVLVMAAAVLAFLFVPLCVFLVDTG